MRNLIPFLSTFILLSVQQDAVAQVSLTFTELLSGGGTGFSISSGNRGLAVNDQLGYLYVTSSSGTTNTIQVFSAPQHEYIATRGLPSGLSRLDAAVNYLNGFTYVSAPNEIYVYNGSGLASAILTNISSPGSIAINNVNGDIYMVDTTASNIRRYNQAGVFQNTLTLNGGAAPRGLAINSSLGRMYVTFQSGIPGLGTYDLSGNTLNFSTTFQLGTSIAASEVTNRRYLINGNSLSVIDTSNNLLAQVVRTSFKTHLD